MSRTCASRKEINKKKIKFIFFIEISLNRKII